MKLAERFPLTLLFPRHYTPSFLCACESFFLALRRLLSWCFPFQRCEVCRSICSGCGFWRSFIDAHPPALLSCKCVQVWVFILKKNCSGVGLFAIVGLLVLTFAGSIYLRGISWFSRRLLWILWRCVCQNGLFFHRCCWAAAGSAWGDIPRCHGAPEAEVEKQQRVEPEV